MEQGYIKPTCPQCGSHLLVERDGAETMEEDKVSCPVHGYLGTAKEVRDRFASEQPEEFRRQVEEQARKAVQDMLRKAGFNLE